MNKSKSLMLINLGSPNSCAEKDVKNYLKQFLLDPYVIDYPYLLRRFIVQMILWRRPKITAQNYAKIWQDAGSPLIINSEKIRSALEKELDETVVLAMRYGNPSIAEVMHKLAQNHIFDVTLLPMYPHFTQSTVLTAIHAAQQINNHQFAGKFKFTIVPPFFQHHAYIESLCRIIQPYLTNDFEQLVFSFHGIPERHIRKLTNPINPNHDLNNMFDKPISDELLAKCYRSQCIRTASLTANHLKLPPTKWSFAFQSRLGGGKWIAPYLDEHLSHLASSEIRKILLVSPSFMSDCIETLEELNIRYVNELAKKNVILDVIPCLNDDSYWITSLAKIIKNT